MHRSTRALRLPIAPPHPAPTVSGHSAPPQTSSGSESSEKQTPRQCLMEVCVLLLFITIIWGAFAAYLVYTTPSFRVASVSVLLDKSNDSSLATCTWNMGLSVKAGKVFNEFDFNDLEVFCFVACLLRIGQERYLSNPRTIETPKT